MRAPSCPTFCNPMDCCLTGSSVHEIVQVRMLEWVPTPGDLANPGIKPMSLVSPKRFLCHVHFLHIDSGVDYPNMFTSERLNSILRSVHFTFSTFTSLKKKAIGMRLLKYIGKSNIS